MDLCSANGAGGPLLLAPFDVYQTVDPGRPEEMW
jgi:hypothetical protein